jgi:hypothetical protein
MSSSILCRQCNQPITFDNKHISQRTGKKIPLDVETNEPHDCPVRRDQPQTQQTQQGHNSNHKNKGAIYNVTKAADRRSILMQITRAKAVNTCH